MLGAILGDMVGAPFEFDRGNKTKDFEMFGKGVGFTDDSVMTIAVAEAMLDSKGKSDDEVKKALVSSMQKWGHEYPNAGYGGMFYQWLRDKNPKPYGSFGNGSAMRVSSVGWLFLTMEETRKYARLSAEVTHNHPEGIKGAEATAACIFLARHKASKEQIKDYVIREFGYDLSRTCDEIRPHYHHVESCQQTVPEAITAFLEGTDFEAAWPDKPVNTGTYTVTIKGIGKYTGTTNATYTINKAENPITLKAKAVKVGQKKLKKKAQRFTASKVLTVREAKGKLSYKLVSVKKGKKSFKKKLSIDAKTGRVTVKKGLKKGTYKVKVGVRAAGDANYNASVAKSVTFKIIVQ